MDAISQLQEKVNTIATIAFTTIGTLQRDAPPVRISPNYPESGSGPAPAAAPNPNPTPTPTPTADSDADFAKQPKLMSAELVKAAKQFDALVAALPLSEGGEEAQLKRIAQLEAENDAVGQQLEKQLEAAVKGGIFFHLPSLLPFKSSHQIREGAYANNHYGR
ncbi:PREDICTED: mediator [Prunus dulcis]|uniref:Mediator of RNA polymerase II transcription subunit 21 n=1 Tax=Prunus dulcis TaxID=3755 RepID=A0A5E4FM26_PRUDU|nr:PREDICTED: mediator [Prunus dulcis]